MKREQPWTTVKMKKETFSALKGWAKDNMKFGDSWDDLLRELLRGYRK